MTKKNKHNKYKIELDPKQKGWVLEPANTKSVRSTVHRGVARKGARRESHIVQYFCKRTHLFSRNSLHVSVCSSVDTKIQRRMFIYLWCNGLEIRKSVRFSVFSIPKPPFRFRLIFFLKLKTKPRIWFPHAHPSTRHTALFALILKTTRQLANIQASHTNTLLHQKKKKCWPKEKKKWKPKVGLKKVGSVFDISVRFFRLKPNRRHH